MDVDAPKFTDMNESFQCTHCGCRVSPSKKSCRNHCPECLHSIHLDIHPGDRRANCGGLMVPVEFLQHSKKGWQVVHRCTKCQHVSKNVLDFDDPQQPDSMNTVLAHMQQSSRG